jgi:hypothetical protein
MSSKIDLTKNYSDKNITSTTDQTSRRAFVRQIGKTILSITVVGWVGTATKKALACGEGISDSTCGNNYNSDGNCGVSKDPDNNCGIASYNSNDLNCGKSSSGGMPTGGPNGADRDEACMPASSDSDTNCSIAQIPVGGSDVDQSCNADGSDTDQSCGDCDDNHQSDEHCGEPIMGSTIDPDDLCGHQHVASGTTDHVCSATVNDVGCGMHITEYGGTWKDTDQNCTSVNPVDMNCSSAILDSNCGIKSNPSTTSPDENCSMVDRDEACSRYDKDESCGSGSSRVSNAVDEACGTTTIAGWFDPVDNDNNCGTIDPDNSSSTTTCPQGGG